MYKPLLNGVLLWYNNKNKDFVDITIIAENKIMSTDF